MPSSRSGDRADHHCRLGYYATLNEAIGRARAARRHGARLDTVSIVALELYREKLIQRSITADRPDTRFLLDHRLQEKNYVQSAYDPSDNRPAWNTSGKLKTKRQLKPKENFGHSVHADQESQARGRALFDSMINSQLRWRILGKIRIGDSVAGVRGRS